MVDLPKALEALNRNGKYDHLITRAKAGGYHDFKFIELPQYNNCVCPKMELVSDLAEFEELSDLRDEVINGVYDDAPDEADKESLRKDLEKEPNGEAIKKMLGL